MSLGNISIGASDVAAILGLSPWQSPSATWARLRGLSDSGSSNATRRGHTLELGVLMEYADRHELKVYPWRTAHRHLHRQAPPFRVGLYRGPSIEEPRIAHREVEWAGCRPDAIVLYADGSKSLVEVKTTRSFRDWQDAEGNAILPPHYVVQVQWQMWVMGCNTTDVEAFCVMDDSRRSYRVPRDSQLIERIVGLVTAWVEAHLVGNKLPEDMPADIAGLVWPAPREPETWLDGTMDDFELGKRYLALSEDIKLATAERDRVRDKLCVRIGDAAGITGIATWKATSRGRTFRCLMEVLP